jgi:hypothetical protein
MTEQPPEHEEAPVDKAVSGPLVDEGTAHSIIEKRSDEQEPETFPLAYVQKL